MKTPPFMAFAIALVPVLMGTQCETESVTASRSCEVVLESPTPTEGEPGAEITLPASPLTSIQDSRLFVGGVDATLVSVDRTGCESCDACLAEAECSPCEDCDSCDAICATECSESLRFLVPELDPGSVEIGLYNLFGNSNTVPFTVSESASEPDTASP